MFSRVSAVEATMAGLEARLAVAEKVGDAGGDGVERQGGGDGGGGGGGGGDVRELEERQRKDTESLSKQVRSLAETVTEEGFATKRRIGMLEGAVEEVQELAKKVSELGSRMDTASEVQDKLQDLNQQFQEQVMDLAGEAMDKAEGAAVRGGQLADALAEVYALAKEN